MYTGDDPPRDRTSELRALGFPSRHLGPIQMTTDTALGVAKRVVIDKGTPIFFFTPHSSSTGHSQTPRDTRAIVYPNWDPNVNFLSFPPCFSATVPLQEIEYVVRTPPLFPPLITLSCKWGELTQYYLLRTSQLLSSQKRRA